MRQLLVLDPWEIKVAHGYVSRFDDASGMYAKFHNQNEMATELCKEYEQIDVDIV